MNKKFRKNKNKMLNNAIKKSQRNNYFVKKDKPKE
jgi:hypothetical protein